jgi:peptidyl-prolyl cis-trans isomerase D
MLRFLRKYSRSTGVKILYGVLAALFVVWGVGAIGGEQIDVVARVHDERISRRELDRATVALERRYAEMRLPAELLRSVDLHQQALDQLIDQALMRHAAAELGIGVSDAEVVDFITRMPELQEGGRFARERLEAFLESQRDRGEFEAQIRTGLLAQRLQALVIDGVAVSDAEVEERYRFDRTQVSLAFARVAAAELAKAVTLSDEELQKYLDEHAQRYTVPTRVRARYVAFRPADFAAQVTPTDGEIAEYYELHTEERFTRQGRGAPRPVRRSMADEAAKTARRAPRHLAERRAARTSPRRRLDDLLAAKGDLGFSARRMTPGFRPRPAAQPGQASDTPRRRSASISSR